jgi:hypothetical protein
MLTEADYRNNHTIILDINRCTTLFTFVIQAVRAPAEVTLEPRRSCPLLASALVHVVLITELSFTSVLVDVS